MATIGRARRAPRQPAANRSSSPSTRSASRPGERRRPGVHRAAVVCPLRRAGGGAARTCGGDVACSRRRRRRATGAERPGAASARVLTLVPVALLALLAVTDAKVRAAIATPAGLAVVVLGAPAQRRRCAVDAPDHRTADDDGARGDRRSPRSPARSSWPRRGRRRRAVAPCRAARQRSTGARQRPHRLAARSSLVAVAGVAVAAVAAAGLGPAIVGARRVVGAVASRRRSADRARARRSSRAMPDAIELMVMCLHAGLTPTQAVGELARLARPRCAPASRPPSSGCTVAPDSPTRSPS